MNTYVVDYQMPFGVGHSQTVEATNIHTAVKKVLYPLSVGRKPVAIRRGQTMTIRVERIK